MTCTRGLHTHVGGWWVADTNYLYPARWGWIKNCSENYIMSLVLYYLQNAFTIFLNLIMGSYFKILCRNKKIMMNFPLIKTHIYYHIQKKEQWMVELKEWFHFRWDIQLCIREVGFWFGVEHLSHMCRPIFYSKHP